MSSTPVTRFMAAIRSIESGGDYHAVGPATSYGRPTGAYQFLDGTWGGYRGYQHAGDAPPAVQDARARELMTAYHREFGSWELVAVAWHAGPGAARRAMHDPSYPQRLSDGYVSTASYVDTVMRRVHRGTPSTPTSMPYAAGDLRPWQVPDNVAGRAGRIVVDPDQLQQLSRRLTEHLATVESAYLRCREAVADAGRAAHGQPLASALSDALDEWAGLPRLPRLLTRDVGFVVEARLRALGADDGAHRPARSTVEHLIQAVVRPGTAVGARVTTLLRDLYRPDRTPRIGLPSTPDHHRPTLRDVTLGRAWGGAQSIFAQFVTPFMRREGLVAGSQKRPYDTVRGPGMSDHYSESRSAYAIDYPTTSGADEARALARALGNPSWQPNSFATFPIHVDGADFRVQILWGDAVDHDDHVHVGIRRV